MDRKALSLSLCLSCQSTVSKAGVQMVFIYSCFNPRLSQTKTNPKTCHDAHAQQQLLSHQTMWWGLEKVSGQVQYDFKPDEVIKVSHCLWMSHISQHSCVSQPTLRSLPVSYYYIHIKAQMIIFHISITAVRRYISQWIKNIHWTETWIQMSCSPVFIFPHKCSEWYLRLYKSGC